MASTLSGTAYVPFISGSLPDILCEHHERTVGNDKCVSFEGLSLQLPAGEMRHHYVRTRVRVHRYVDDTLGVLDGPRKLASYDVKGRLARPRSCSERPPEGRLRSRARAAKPLRATPCAAT